MTNNPKNTAMNLEYKDIIETNRSKNDPAILSDKSSGETLLLATAPNPKLSPENH